METNGETNNATEHNMGKNPIWQEADQMAIYKGGQGVEPGSAEKVVVWKYIRQALTHSFH